MQPSRRIAAATIALALALAACGGGGSGDSPVAESDLEGPAAAGQATYEARCAVCHKRDLSGGTGPSLRGGSEASGKPVDDLRRVIVEGGTGMPAWDGVLTAAEIDEVIDYLRAAQGR